MTSATTPAQQITSAGLIDGGVRGDTVFRALQLNCNLRCDVSPAVATYMVEHRVQVAMLQEHHVVAGSGRPTGFPQGMQVFSNERAGAGNKAAIIINAADIEAVIVTDLTSEWGTCVWTKGPYGEMYICSMYCKFRVELTQYMAYLEQVKQRAGRVPLLVGMDANARSRMWHSKVRLNCRGHETYGNRAEDLEELLLRNNMQVVNEPSPWFTFCGPRGQSDIDVTVANEALTTKFASRWEVKPEAVHSDHNLLLITLRKEDEPEISEQAGTRWNTKGANWPVFREKVHTAVALLERDHLSADQLQLALDDIIVDACRACLREEQPVVAKKQRWWTPELATAKKEVRRLRVLYQRARRGTTVGEAMTPLVEQRKREYQRMDRRYANLIRTTRATDWQRFVREDGNNNPWGVVYRMCRGKAATVIGGMKRADQSFTSTWPEAADILLRRFLPSRDPAEETPSVDAITAHPEHEPITEREVAVAIGRFNARRAPGLDGKRADVYKQVFQASPQVIVELFNKCLSAGRFPAAWKEGHLVTFLKAPDKDRSDAGSYRPITLLPVIGKVLERVLVNRLQLAIGELCPTQFGFRSGLSTVDAWMKAKELVAECPGKYVVGIFVDFKGAFDHLNWGSIIRKLHDIGCREIAVWRDFFKDRRSCLMGKRLEEWRELTRGCPQGSISGPIIWNIMMDELLTTLTTAGIRHVAYADDLLLIIDGRSRDTLELSSNAAMELVVSWGARVGLQVSFEKTEALMLRGSFDAERRPKIIGRGQRVRFKDEVRYLGVHVGEGMRFEVHIKKTTAKIKNVIGPLRRVLKRDWGLKRRAVRQWLNGLLTPIATYGAVVWVECARSVKGRQMVDSMHRVVLAACLRTCRTVSTHAKQVLMRSLPWDLEVGRQAVRYKLRKGLPMSPRDMLSEAEAAAGGARKTLDERATEMWQQRWNESTKGRVTFQFIPIVGQPMSDDFDPTTYTLFLLTGHGSMNEYLEAHTRTTESAECLCGAGSENWRHILMDCFLYDDLRDPVKMAIDIENMVVSRVLETEESFAALSEFADAVFRRRITLLAG